MALKEFLTGVADAIRGKTGETGVIPASEFPARISGIQTGVDTSGDTVTDSVLLDGYTAHNAAGEQISGSLIPLAQISVSNYRAGSCTLNDVSYYPQSTTCAGIHVSGTTDGTGEYFDIEINLSYS